MKKNLRLKVIWITSLMILFGLTSQGQDNINNTNSFRDSNDFFQILEEDHIITNFPFNEIFDDDSPTRDYWTQIQEDGEALWTFQAGSSGGAVNAAYAGALNARFVSVPGNGTPITKLVSPVMDLSNLDVPRIKFFYAQQQSGWAWNPNQNETKVYYRVDAESEWVELAHFTENITAWTQVVLSLPNPTATYQVAFEGINYTGNANVIDDVVVEESPPSYTVTFHVENDEGEDIANAVITLGNVTNPTGDYVFESIEAGEYSYLATASGFNQVGGTVNVVDEDIQENIVMSMFLKTLPYTENFEGTAEFELPEGWSSDHDSWHVFDLWSMPGVNWPGGEVLLLWDYEMSGAYELRVESPLIDATAVNGVTMSFEHLVLDYDGNYTLKVQTSTDGLNWTDQWNHFVAGGDIPLTEINLTLTGVDGEMFQVAFVAEHPNGISNDLDTWAIAEFSIEEAYEGDLYTVTFQVDDHDGNPIDNAVITLDGVTNNPGEYVFEDLTSGTYTYSVVAPGFEETTGAVQIVDADITEVVSLIPISGFTVAFEVVDQDASVVGNATITLGDTTNTEGDYQFEEILPGTYNYTVVAEGFYSEEGTIEVVDQNVFETVVLTQIGMYTVSFDVIDADSFTIEHATISIRNQVNPQGNYVFENVEEGPLTWVVFAEGYKLASDIIILNNNQNITVVLVEQSPVAGFPWLEDFDDTDSFFPPDGWAQVKIGESNSSSWISAIGGIDSGRMLEHGRSPLGYANNWMISPAISIPENADELNYELSYWERTLFMHSYQYGGVLISTGSANPVAGNFIEVHESDETQVDFAQVFIDLADFAGQNIYIAFVFQGQGAHMWRIDNVMVSGDEAPVYTVSFQVENNNGEPIENAIITLGNITNQPGEYVFTDIEPGEYNYIVEADGFYASEGTVNVVDADIIETVIMDPVITYYTVTFIVKNANGGAINQAVITLGEVQNEPGNYVFGELLPGEYDYLIQKDGYFDQTGSLSLTDEDLTLEVVLVKDDTHVNEIIPDQLIIYPNPANSMVTVSLSGQSVKILELIDIHGQVVFRDVFNESQVRFNAGMYTPGFYFVRITTDESIFVKRLNIIQ